MAQADPARSAAVEAADLGTTVVTGAGGGMGRAAALRFAAPGRRLMLCELREDALADVVAATRAKGAEVTTLAGDVADPQFPDRLIAQLGDAPIGVLAHTAGLSPTMADAARILEVNLFAVRRLVEALRPHMARGGSIVLISSCSAYMIPPGAFAAPLKAWLETDKTEPLLSAAPEQNAAYPASKRGVIDLVAQQASACGEAGIRINSISPGFIDTPMGRAEMKSSEQMVRMIGEVPLGRMGDGDEIASVVEFLCSPAASYVTGCDIKVDGGILGRMGL